MVLLYSRLPKKIVSDENEDHFEIRMIVYQTVTTALLLT